MVKDKPMLQLECEMNHTQLFQTFILETFQCFKIKLKQKNSFISVWYEFDSIQFFKTLSYNILFL